MSRGGLAEPAGGFGHRLVPMKNGLCVGTRKQCAAARPSVRICVRYFVRQFFVWMLL
jgi:hypothetical protein